MRVIDIDEVQGHLSRLVDDAAGGKPFIIAKAGRPLVKVVAVEPARATRRLGFLTGEIDVPDDFDRMGADAIARHFGAEP